VQAALAAFIRPDQPKPLVSRISIDRALATLKTIHWAAPSDPDRWAGYHVRAISRQPDCGYRTRDGWITLDFLPDQREAWRAMCEELGLGDFAREVEDNWFSTIGMEDSIDWARPHYEKVFAPLTRMRRLRSSASTAAGRCRFSSRSRRCIIRNRSFTPRSTIMAAAPRCGCPGASTTRRLAHISLDGPPRWAHTPRRCWPHSSEAHHERGEPAIARHPCG